MSRKHTIPLQNLNGRLIRYISPREALALYSDGAVYLSYQTKKDDLPCLARLIDPRRDFRVIQRCSITPAEMDAYAGRYFRKGQSRTANLPETKKREIEASGKQAEDFIERTEAKVEAWLDRDTFAPLA